MSRASAPGVAVISPTFQHAPYVRECIESVLSQTYLSWEQVIVDDGSSDGTADRAAEIIDPRVSVIRQTHEGLEHLAGTFNKALAASTGEYVAILEGDDRWCADKLAFQVERMRDTSIVLTYARYEVIGAHGQRLAAPPLTRPRADGAFDAQRWLLEGNFIMPVTVLIRRAALERIGGFHQIPGHGHIDYVTWLRLSEIGRFDATDRIVAQWRRHATSETARAFEIKGYFDGPRLCRDAALERLSLIAPVGTAEYVSLKRRVERAWGRALADRYWQTGRVLNVQRRWDDARTLFGRAIRLRDLTARRRALLAFGIVCSVAHVDIEFVISRVRGGSAYSDLEPELTSDRTDLPDDHVPRCPVCRSSFTATPIEEHGTSSLRQCPRCDLQMWYPAENPGPNWYEASELYLAKTIVDWLGWNQSTSLRCIPPGARRLLDVGCADGRFVYAAAAIGIDAVGIDFAERLVREGNARYKGERLKRATLDEFARADPGRFDVVTMLEVVEHVDDPMALLRTAVGLLCPRGTVIISTPNRLGYPRSPGDYDRPPHHLTRWSPMAIENLARMAGLEVTSIEVCPPQIAIKTWLLGIRAGMVMRTLRKRSLRAHEHADASHTDMRLAIRFKDRTASAIGFALAPVIGRWFPGPHMVLVARLPP